MSEDAGSDPSTVDMVELFKSKPKVELHVHLDGSYRPETVFHFAKKRGLPLPAPDVEKLRDSIQLKFASNHGNGPNLKTFLEKFSIFMPSIAGDEEAIKQTAYEWCEDAARQNIHYSEVRFCPHILSNTVDPTLTFAPTAGRITPRRVVELVNEGLKQGRHDFGVKVQSILACMRHAPEWSQEMLDLCVEFRDQGVVAIDVAGSEQAPETFPTDGVTIGVFQRAKQLGINRTVHAGENGTAANVAEAVDELCAQRLGHGYHSLDDSALYERLLREKVHFEVCPYSSFLTGSVPVDFQRHPLRKFLADGADFSVNTDDPLVTGKSLVEEYQLTVDKMGLSWQDILTLIFNGADAAFLPPDEKQDLVDHLKKEYSTNFDVAKILNT